MTEPIHRNSLKPGHRLHWYRIEKVLGQGSFGITYLARDSNLDQEVAIKEYLPMELAVRTQDFVVHPASNTHGERFQWGLDRFIAEAQTLARFKHPNIVRVLAVFEANRTGYMVMEYEHGDTLHEILTRRQTLEEEELLNIVLPILGGLEKVHERGFIHRDIKPANIFIRDDGSPLLIDFGSARQALGAEIRTLTTLVSPGYAPFEQYHSKSEQQGPWTDIYGLGATLYRAVTGQRPQDTMDRNRAILEGARDTLGDVREIGQGRYSAHFLKAIDHALQFRPKDRPQTIAEWRREFGVLPDSRPNVQALDSAMMAATIAADEPRSAPILTAAPSVARRVVPEVQAADSGMAPKITDGPCSESNPPAPPSSVWRTGPHVQDAKVVAEERRSEPLPPSSAPSVVRREGPALALVAAVVVVAAAYFWAYLNPTAPPVVISAKTPSSEPSAAVTLDLGEVVRGRLGDSSKTGKYHYWLIDLPEGKYKFVLDITRADEQNSNIVGKLDLLTSDGAKIDTIGVMNVVDHRHRSLFRIEAAQPLKGILRYGNDFTIYDYYLGVFRDSDPLGSLFFIKAPPVAPLKLGETVTTPILDGDNTRMRDAYYSLTLPAGDYKVNAEYRRVDQKVGNVSGTVSALGEDGDEKIGSLVRVNEIGASGKQTAKLSLADEVNLVFKVRAAFTKYTVVFSVEKWPEE